VGRDTGGGSMIAKGKARGAGGSGTISGGSGWLGRGSMVAGGVGGRVSLTEEIGDEEMFTIKPEDDSECLECMGNGRGSGSGRRRDGGGSAEVTVKKEEAEEDSGVPGKPEGSGTRLNTLGYRMGTRVLKLMVWRVESCSKAPKREIRFLPALMSIHTQVWRAVFGKPADAIEKSVENDDECVSLNLINITFKFVWANANGTADMIIDNDPPLERHVSVPRDMSQLSCSSFTAGIVEAVLDGLGFVSLSFVSSLKFC
jgi:hypothetical protein